MDISVKNAIVCGKSVFVEGQIVDFYDYENRNKSAHTGKIITIAHDKIVLDCSEQYSAHIVTLCLPFNECWDRFELKREQEDSNGYD